MEAELCPREPIPQACLEVIGVELQAQTLRGRPPQGRRSHRPISDLNQNLATHLMVGRTSSFAAAPLARHSRCSAFIRRLVDHTLLCLGDADP
jgi:hypothetical protein